MGRIVFFTPFGLSGFGMPLVAGLLIGIAVVGGAVYVGKQWERSARR